jgi:hypothetical protein
MSVAILSQKNLLSVNTIVLEYSSNDTVVVPYSRSDHDVALVAVLVVGALCCCPQRHLHSCACM